MIVNAAISNPAFFAIAMHVVESSPPEIRTTAFLLIVNINLFLFINLDQKIYYMVIKKPYSFILISIQ